ncbi:MAG: hypothetical protein G01um101431_377 [Parcubacteria group bacterium Gr01-1014_31]|nr:MAG: hypothetical protein G01um101431_377 [Parcubacteria group bacterium Gr01-1014_31]
MVWPAVSRPLLIVLIFGVALRAALFVSAVTQGDAVFLRSNDSPLYLTAAQNLRQYGVFSEYPGDPPTPTMLHLPGYPLFLAATMAANAAPWFTALVQQLLSLATIALAFLVMDAVFGRRVAFWSSLLYGLEPFTVLQANLLMSDTLFVTLLMLAFYCYVRAWTRGWPWLAGCGVTLAAATYVRFSGIYLAGLLMVWWLFGHGKVDLRRALVGTLVMVVVIGGLLSPWIVRNGRQFGLWKLTMQSNFLLLFFHANQAQALREGKTPGQVRGELIREWEALPNDERVRDAFAGRRAREILLSEWRSYVPLYIIKTTPFFLQSGWRDVAESVGLPSGERPVDITTALTRRQWGTVVGALTRTDAPSLAHLAGMVFGAVITLLALAGTFAARRLSPPARTFAFLFAAAIVLTALLSSPLSHARYRQPVQPQLFALAVAGIFGLAAAVGKHRADRAQHNAQVQSE